MSMTETEQVTEQLFQSRWATIQANKQLVALDERNWRMEYDAFKAAIRARDEGEAPVETAPAKAPAKKKGGWPKGKPRGKKVKAAAMNGALPAEA